MPFAQVRAAPHLVPGELLFCISCCLSSLTYLVIWVQICWLHGIGFAGGHIQGESERGQTALMLWALGMAGWLEGKLSSCSFLLGTAEDTESSGVMWEGLCACPMVVRGGGLSCSSHCRAAAASC